MERVSRVWVIVEISPRSKGGFGEEEPREYGDSGGVCLLAFKAHDLC